MTDKPSDSTHRGTADRPTGGGRRTADRRRFLQAATVTAGVGLTGVTGALATQGAQLRAFLWEGYGPIVERFQQEHDVNVSMERATSTNNMFTKANSAPDRYDVVVPNSGYVTRFQEAGLIQPLAANQQELVSRVPNFKNTFDYFRQDTIENHLTDDQGQWYGIPPRFGLYGLALDTSELDPSKLQSSADVWNNRQLWQNDVGVNVDPVHSITHAVRALGYTDMLRGERIDVSGQAWNETKQKFLELAGFTRAMFESEAQLGRALKGDSYDVAIGPGRNDILNLIQKGNTQFEFVSPKEGAIGWTEAMLMMKGAQNRKAVEQFMDFFLRPEIGAMLAKTDLAPSTVKAARKHLSQQEQELFYIPASTVQKVIQDKPFAEPQKWKQLMNQFRLQL